MNALSLDPSSTCIGFCFGNEKQIHQFGRIRPDNPRSEPIHRIRNMIGDLTKLINSHPKLELAIIEIPSGKIHGRFQKRKRPITGLSVYGMAVGAVWLHCLQSIRIVQTVKENEWSQTPKDDRALAVACDHPEITTMKDQGLDIADAVALMKWWQVQQAIGGEAKLQHHEMEGITPAAPEKTPI